MKVHKDKSNVWSMFVEVMAMTYLVCLNISKVNF
jgi:hypothetical protein